MSKRSVSKVFHDAETPDVIIDWLIGQLPLVNSVEPDESDYLKQKICITINLDPDRRGSMIPEGPKEPRRRYGKGKQR